MHLLLVEDDARLGRQLEGLLRGDRHVVDRAASAGEGLEIVAAGAGLDAMILDVGLPDRSGLELTREVRAARSRLPDLILTARDGIDDRVAGLDAGADDYLVKPFAYEELTARLRAIAWRAADVAADPADARLLVRGPIALDDSA